MSEKSIWAALTRGSMALSKGKSSSMIDAPGSIARATTAWRSPPFAPVTAKVLPLSSIITRFSLLGAGAYSRSIHGHEIIGLIESAAKTPIHLGVLRLSGAARWLRQRRSQMGKQRQILVSRQFLAFETHQPTFWWLDNTWSRLTDAGSQHRKALRAYPPTRSSACRLLNWVIALESRPKVSVAVHPLFADEDH